MLINMVLPGAVAAEEPFGFTYSGDFTDNRVDGVGTVRLNTSGTLTVTGKAVTVSATIVGAGGGGVYHTNMSSRRAGGGGGGIQTVEVTLEPGTYDIVIGTGGAGYSGISPTTAGTGGNTTAFGKTSTGGTGASFTSSSMNATVGTGGSPNGNNGSGTAGGAPNGGSAGSNGGDGYVELTFI